MRSHFRSSVFLALTLVVVLLTSIPSAVAQRVEWKVKTPLPDPYAEQSGAVTGQLADQAYLSLLDQISLWKFGLSFIDPRAGNTGIEGASASLIGNKLYVTHGYRIGFGDSSLTSALTLSTLWTHGGPLLPDASFGRSELGGGTAFDKHYAIGGRTGPTAVNEEFDPVTHVWTTKMPMPTPRGGLGVASYENKIYAIGGRTGPTFGSGTILNKNEVYDPTFNTWTTKAPLLHPVSDNSATVALNGKIYVSGGATSPTTVTNELQIYDIALDTWSLGPPMPTARGAAMAGICNRKIFVSGGFVPGSGNLAVSEIFAGGVWIQGPNMPQPASEMAQGVTYNADGILAIGTGIFGTAGTVVQVLCCNSPVPSDFDGDGDTDIAVFRPSAGRWIFRISGTITMQDFGSLTDVPVPGDYDNDGNTDIAVFRPSSGTWFVRRSVDGLVVAQHWGQVGDVPVPGFYDDDKQTDLAVFRPSQGAWYVLKSTGGFLAQSWGTASDKPVIGDFDGDGLTDFTVFRPSEGNWYILRTTGGMFAQPWGLSSDRPVQGDYDGDRVTDIAVFRPSNGNWYVLKSSDGLIIAKHWGLTADVPVRGDYDGDEKADVAVFRPSDGNWYIQSSDAYGTISTVNFGTVGDIPLPATYLPQ